MSEEMVAMVINAAIAILTIVAPAVIAWIVKGAKASKESGELLTWTGAMLEDKKVTPDEIAKWMKEAKDVGDLFQKSGAEAFKAKQVLREVKKLKKQLEKAK